VPIDISLWQSPPTALTIETEELHLWRFRTDISAQKADILRQSLSADECVRADRFIRPFHQIKFIAARYGLRRILARYLECLSGSVGFDYGPQGKPSLVKQHRSDFNFNLSHSGDWAIIAVSAGPDIGVDVEEVKDKDNLQQLGDYAFDKAEKRLFAAFSPTRKQRGFYRLWTAKEARLKMLGVGLGNMNKVVMPVYEHFFVPAKGYVAAFAVDHHVARIVRYHDVLTR